MLSVEIVRHVCPLCEAGCGLETTVDAGAVHSIRGNHEHVFSRGHLCPKAFGWAELHADSDRLRTPLVRDQHRDLRPASWDEAFATIERRLMPLIERYGRDAVAVYLGNPVVHDFATLLYASAAVRFLGSRNL